MPTRSIMKCSWCNGSGKMYRWTGAPFVSEDAFTPVPCRSCDGTGRRPFWPGLKEWWELKVVLRLYIWWDVHFSKD